MSEKRIERERGEDERQSSTRRTKVESRRLEMGCWVSTRWVEAARCPAECCRDCRLRLRSLPKTSLAADISTSVTRHSQNKNSAAKTVPDVASQFRSYEFSCLLY